jgi:hypothetical protein
MILEILSHTPIWVWGLLAALLALGWSQTRTRHVAPPRLLILPLVLMGLGLTSMAPGFAAVPLTAAVWLLALLAGAALLASRAPSAGAQWLPTEQRLQLPGSWVPMLLIIVIFSLRYSANVGMAFNPGWRSAPEVLLPLSLLYGGLSGFFLGRALGLFKLTRQPATRPVHAERRIA